MEQLEYEINCVSPLLISSAMGDENMVATRTSIPGNTVLGLLARQVILQKNLGEMAHEDKSFFRWFFQGRVGVSDARIAGEAMDGSVTDFFPIPLSIRAEKYTGALFDFLYYEPVAEESFKAVEGYCRMEGAAFRPLHVKTSLNFHHARDRALGASKPGDVFNYEAICSEQTFRGKLTGDKEELKELASMIPTPWLTAHVGRSRNAQYGTVRFRLLDEKPRPIPASGIEWENPISLTLLSDTIVYNENGAARACAGALERYLCGAKIQKAFLKRSTADSFVGVWRLKKPAEPCIAAGSAFLIDISLCDPKDLERLRTVGIGERTHEGHGRCEFGLQKKASLFYDQPALSPVEKPEGEIPERVKKVLRTIAANSLVKHVELMALQEGDRFRRLPPNSLLGRLEAMIGQVRDERRIVGLLDNLGNSPKNKLMRCNNGQVTLFDFLKQKPFEPEMVMEKVDGLSEIAELVGFEIDSALKGEMSGVFRRAFLAMMRKNSRKGGLNR